MEHVNKYLNMTHLLTDAKQPLPSNKPSEDLMGRLWVKMSGVWGHQWEKSYGSTPTEGWEDCLTGMTAEHFSRGYKKMIESGMSWPPNAIEFRALCKPTGEDLGLLPELEAYQQAIAHRRADRAPEVVFTMQAIGGSYDFGQKKSNEARKQFSAWYAKTIDHVLSGGKLPEPVLEVEHQRLRTPNKEGQARIQAIMASIGK